MSKKLKRKFTAIVTGLVLVFAVSGVTTHAITYVTGIKCTILPVGTSGGYYYNRATGNNNHQSALAYLTAGIKGRSEVGWNYGSKVQSSNKSLVAKSPSCPISKDPIGKALNN